MRLIKPTEDLPFDYLRKDEVYQIESLNGGPYDQIYFTNIVRKSGTYLREQRVKKLLCDGSLIFVD